MTNHQTPAAPVLSVEQVQMIRENWIAMSGICDSHESLRAQAEALMRRVTFECDRTKEHVGVKLNGRARTEYFHPAFLFRQPREAKP